MLRFKSYPKLFACVVVLIAVLCSTVRADVVGKTTNQVTGTVFVRPKRQRKRWRRAWFGRRGCLGWIQR